jgi:hypothetical protein
MNDRTIRLFPQGSGSLGLMPVPADLKPGEYKLDLLDKDGASVETVSIRVLDSHFPKQNVVIGQSIAELKPSPGETETVTAFRNAVSDTRHWSEPLALPVRGCMTSPFGVQRYMNGKPTGNFHGGLDQREDRPRLEPPRKDCRHRPWPGARIDVPAHVEARGNRRRHGQKGRRRRLCRVHRTLDGAASSLVLVCERCAREST